MSDMQLAVVIIISGLVIVFLALIVLIAMIRFCGALDHPRHRRIKRGAWCGSGIQGRTGTRCS